MKYICLGYIDETEFNAMSNQERDTFMSECFAFAEDLKRSGHLLADEALDSIQNATTLKHQNGRITITDGPYIETKEYLGGFMIIEATDLNHAIQLLSKNPCLRKRSTFEIRPIVDLEPIKAQCQARQEKPLPSAP